MPRRRRDRTLGAGELDLNRVIAANVRAARELRGWTQEETASRLSGALGYVVPQASVSIIERSVTGDRQRNISADELAGFAVAFDLPLLWFLRPTRSKDRLVVGPTEFEMGDLATIVFGTDRQAEELRRAIDPRCAVSAAASLSSYSIGEVERLVDERDAAFAAQLDATRPELQIRLEDLASVLASITATLAAR